MTSACPLCGHTDLFPVLQRERTMVSANMLYDTAAEARAAPAGALRIELCRHCGFVFNAAFVLELVPYGVRYDNDQSRSGHFAGHMRAMAGRVRAALGTEPLRAVEIGCGKAQFLRLILATDPRPGDRAVGFDPSYDGEPIPGCEIHHAFFTPESIPRVGFAPNVVISRHVIEHVPDPRGMIATIAQAYADVPAGLVFFETPSIAWIFEHDAFWDLCYEHCSYFTPSSLRYAFETCGFRERATIAAFGGQYMWFEAVRGAAPAAAPLDLEALARGFVERIGRLQTTWHERLEQLAATGPVAVWGAATKGARFVQDVDGDARLVRFLIDINPNKQGRYVPLTGHPVVAWETARSAGVAAVIVTNPNYVDEIRAQIGPDADRLTILTL